MQIRQIKQIGLFWSHVTLKPMRSCNISAPALLYLSVALKFDCWRYLFLNQILLKNDQSRTFTHSSFPRGSAWSVWIHIYFCHLKAKGMITHRQVWITLSHGKRVKNQPTATTGQELQHISNCSEGEKVSAEGSSSRQWHLSWILPDISLQGSTDGKWHRIT